MPTPNPNRQSSLFEVEDDRPSTDRHHADFGGESQPVDPSGVEGYCMRIVADEETEKSSSEELMACRAIAAATGFAARDAEQRRVAEAQRERIQAVTDALRALGN
jgi:hypothetical protein